MSAVSAPKVGDAIDGGKKIATGAGKAAAGHYAGAAWDFLKAFLKLFKFFLYGFFFTVISIVMAFCALFYGLASPAAASDGTCGGALGGGTGAPIDFKSLGDIQSFYDANGHFIATKGARPDPKILKIAYSVAQKQLAGNPNASAITVALFEAGLQESSFTNYTNSSVAGAPPESDSRVGATGHDHTSIGYLQQLANSNWGTIDQELDPVHATSMFLKAAVQVTSKDPNTIAQNTQRSATPLAYGPHQAQAQSYISQLSSTMGPIGAVASAVTGAVTGAASAVGGAISGAVSTVTGGSQTAGLLTNSDCMVSAAFPGQLVCVTGPDKTTWKTGACTGGVGTAINMPSDAKRAGFIETALAQQGKPYVYGATGPSTFDCSGLVLYSARANNIPNVPRVAAEQYSASRHVSATEAIPGDLVFFDNPIGHVGIYLGIVNGKRMMVAAPHTGDVVKIQEVYSSDVVYGSYFAAASATATATATATAGATGSATVGAGAASSTGATP